MLTQRVCRFKTTKSTCFDISDANPGGFTQGSQTQVIFRLPALDQPQTFAQHFAGVLVTTRNHQLFNKVGLMVGENNISGWHMNLSDKSRCVGILCHKLYCCLLYTSPSP